MNANCETCVYYQTDYPHLPETRECWRRFSGLSGEQVAVFRASKGVDCPCWIGKVPEFGIEADEIWRARFAQLPRGVRGLWVVHEMDQGIVGVFWTKREAAEVLGPRFRARHYAPGAYEYMERPSPGHERRMTFYVTQITKSRYPSLGWLLEESPFNEGCLYLNYRTKKPIPEPFIRVFCKWERIPERIAW